MGWIKYYFGFSDKNYIPYIIYMYYKNYIPNYERIYINLPIYAYILKNSKKIIIKK